jgi:hypothetical protein
VPKPEVRRPSHEPAVSAALTNAVEELRETTDALAKFAAPPPPESETPDTTPPPSRADEKEDAVEEAQYLRHLRARGELMDVDEGADLAALPPTVTHVRYPDGRVQRVGYR